MKIGEIAIAGAASAMAGAAIYLSTLLRGGDHARYELSATALVGAFLAPLALWAIGRGRRPVLGAIAFAATALMLTGLLTVFSGIGLFILPFGLVAVVLAARYIRWQSLEDVASTIGGIVASIALGLVVLAQLSPPLVDCAGPHAQVSIPSGARTSTATSADGRRESGTIFDSGRTLRYVCEHEQLVEFSSD